MSELILFVTALVVHECGHIIAALLLGVHVVSFNIISLGGVFTFDFSRVGYIKEVAVHLSGAIVGLLTAFIAYLLFGARAYFFTGLSTALSLVNLLPIEGFDGGGIIRCILSLFLFPDTVWRACRIFSLLGSVALLTAVIWTELRAGGNLGLMIFVIGIMLGQMKLNHM